MPLVNLKTEYTKLKFGKDQPGGGSSNEPFITSNSRGVITTPSGDIYINGSITDSRGLFNDWPIRGGVYPSNEIDYRRINAFLKTTKGKQFIDKQKVLQFMNPKIETAPSFLRVDSNSIIPGLIENTRVYSEKGLLNQVLIQGTGFHLFRTGTPSLGVYQEFYANTTGLQNISNSSTLNRLELLRKLKIVGLENINTGTFDSIANITLAKKMGLALTPFAIFNYSGGPTSSDRQPNTIIGRYTNTTLVDSDIVMGYAQLAAQKPVQNGTSYTYKDFRESIPAYQNEAGSRLTWNTFGNTLESTLYKKGKGVINAGVIQKGLPHGKPTDYVIPVASDKINMLMPYLVTDSTKTPWDGSTDAKDSIKLTFECMSNDNTSTSTALVFRALLSSGFTDSNSAILNSFRYAGRGDELFTYQGFSRSISFSFKIAAFSRQELKPLYNKLNYLISQVYPDYSGTTGVMRAPLVKVTLGDYLYRVPGFLENVNITVDNSTSWEINLEESTDVQELPHVLEVSISFKPIHNILPERSAYKEIIRKSTQTIENPYNTLSGYGVGNTQVDTSNDRPVNQVSRLIGNSENNFISPSIGLETIPPTIPLKGLNLPPITTTPPKPEPVT